MIAQSSTEWSALQSQINQILVHDRVPGLAVAVAQRGKIVWEQGFGWADREHHIRATANTPFFLASVTKSLTSTAIMVLNQSGKLDLDSPINKYLGPAQVRSPMWNAEEATVRRVATHMAGLSTFYRTCKVGETQCSISIHREIARYGILFWPPGERFDYSNLGYSILGEAVAHASKQSFADFLQTNVFQPLGMKHCALIAPHNAAANYDQHTHKRTAKQISGSPGASAAYCSAHDLALFAMFHLKDHLSNQRQILTDAALDELHRPVTHLSGQQYAIGWWTDQRAGQPVMFGQGGTTDSFTLVELFPSADLAIVLLANSWSDGFSTPNAIEQAILAKVLPKAVGGLAQAKAGNSSLPYSSQLVGKWSGYIATQNGRVPVTITITDTPKGSGHVATAPDERLRNLALKGDHIYGILSADLHEDDAPPPYDIELDMFLRGATLAGAATTRPGPNGNAQLPHWIQLEKVP